MLGKVFSCIIALSFLFAVFTGNMQALSECVTAAAGDAVTLSISLLGLTGLWSGVIRVLERAGAMKAFSRLLRPVLSLLYPAAARTGRGMDEIAANFAANLLGLGNAALPLGLSVMRALTPSETAEKAEETGKGENTEIRERAALLADRFTFTVMNTVPPQIFPTTLIALRTAAGSENPCEILFPIWLCSLGTVLFAGFLCRLCTRRQTALGRAAE